jgi:hypothetical protein
MESKILNWIETFVEVPNEKLNGWSPCPYARQARLDNKIKIVNVENDNIFYDIITNLDSLNEGKDIVIYCIKDITAQRLDSVITELNRHRYNSNYVFLEDHPMVEEYVNGLKMNFGECTLILAQKLDKLNEASTKLKSKGYYDVWSAENLEDVVNWRTK